MSTPLTGSDERGRAEDLVAQADAALAAGQLRDALRLFSRASKVDPQNAAAFHGAAKAHNRLFDPAAARRDIQRAIRLRPNSVECLCELAHAEALSDKHEEALRVVDSALAISPTNGQAICGKGEFLRRLGRSDESLAVLHSAYEAGERHEGVVALLAELLAEGGSVNDAIEIVNTALGAGSQPVRSRAMLLNRLSIGLEKAGAFAEAFDAARRMNESRNAQWDTANSDAWFEERIRICDKETVAAIPTSGVMSEAPVFIVGMPRSGTSLVEQILDCHPDVVGIGEREEMFMLVLDLYRASGEDRTAKERLTLMPSHVVESRAKAHLRLLRQLAPGAKRVTDKMPANLLYLPEIRALFPRARIIYCRRDPRDTCLSCYMTDFGEAHPYAMEFESLAHYYAGYERLMERYKTSVDMQIHEVQYEDLVTDSETGIRRLVSFLGLEWSDACLEHHKSKRIVRTASEQQARRPIYKASLGRWRRYEQQIQPLLQSLGDLDVI